MISVELGLLPRWHLAFLSSWMSPHGVMTQTGYELADFSRCWSVEASPVQFFLVSTSPSVIETTKFLTFAGARSTPAPAWLTLEAVLGQRQIICRWYMTCRWINVELDASEMLADWKFHAAWRSSFLWVLQFYITLAIFTGLLEELEHPNEIKWKHVCHMSCWPQEIPLVTSSY